MRNLRRICALGLCVAVLCTSCGTKQSEVTVEKTNVVSHQGDEISYDIIEPPSEIDQDRLYNMYINAREEEYPRMILKLIKEDNKTFEYIEYQLEDDFSWTRREMPWSQKVSETYEEGTETMVADSKGNLYASTTDKDNKLVILRLTEKGEAQELDLSEAENVYKDLVPTSFDIINDNQLVLFYEEDPEQTGARTDVVIYDCVEERILDRGQTISNDVVFDKNGNYYMVSLEQQMVQKYTIHDTLPDKVIQCDGISEIVFISDLLIEDDKGYIKTNAGIYGGKLTDEQWSILLPIEKMYYNKDIETFRGNPLAAFCSFTKVQGDDCEFFVETLRDNDTLEFDWVHYYKNETR